MLEVVNSYGNRLSMDLRKPDETGYIITGINGLGPVDVDIKQTQMVSGLKYKYNKGFHKYRDITIQFLFDEWNINRISIDQLRIELMNYFKTDDLVTLYFYKDTGEIRKIDGWVSKNEPAYFSNACGAQVIITCPDPWFIKVNDSIIGEDRYYLLYSSEDSSSITVSFELDSGENADITNVQVLKSSEVEEEDGTFTYTAEFNYEGSITTGFQITFSDLIEDMAGDLLTIESYHGASGQNGIIYIREPNEYGSDIEDYNLNIDTSLDFLAVEAISSNNKKNVIGWVDSSTISKRKSLPNLNKGNNVITINSSIELCAGSGSIVANVYFHTLYRGI